MKRLIEIRLSNCRVVSSPKRIDISKMKSARAFKQTKICKLNSPRTLLTSEPLFGDPVPYIAATMDNGDAFCFTCCEEANDIQVDQAYFVQVERDARPPDLYLRFQFFYMLPSHAANQP